MDNELRRELKAIKLMLHVTYKLAFAASGRVGMPIDIDGFNPPEEPIQSFWDEKQSAMAKRIADSILPAVKELKTISQEERRKLIKRVNEIVKMNYPESHKERR